MSGVKVYETARLVLKPTSLSDAAFLFELMNTPKWIANIGDRNINSETQAKQYILEKIMPQIDRLGYGSYTLFKKNSGFQIGTCGLFDRDGLEGVDIGFALLPQYENQGYAFESAMKIKEIALDHFELKNLRGICNKENIASQNLLKKLGMVFSGNIKLPNEKEEIMLFELLLPQA